MNPPASPTETLGARWDGQATHFAVYARPGARVSVRLFAAEGRPIATHAMSAGANGHHFATLREARPGTLYKFVVDEQELPDPYARRLPHGVHGPAEVVASSYVFRTPEGPKRPLSEQVLYELHVGTFTPEGTYDAAGAKLGELVRLGVTTIELMPISSFPGRRGWGYDGVAHFAPYEPYGSPDALRRLVDHAHGLDLAVLLDVVYNHLGPSGNYLGSYSPDYFTAEYENAWGVAPRFDHPAMRRYVLSNVRYWLEEFRIDGLRLDATHAIFDPSVVSIIHDIVETARRVRAGALVIAEDERNEPGLVIDAGCDAIWADDFHHQVRVTLSGENDGYFAAYRPGVEDLARIIERGWLYEGQPSVALHGKPRGAPADALPAESFVYCIQNHDQVGNRAFGTRLDHDTSIEDLRLAATVLLFLPMTPLLFMGQEWASSSPFQYFTDHDPELGALVTEGRRKEFARFEAFSDPERRSKIPDPQSEETFLRSRLDWLERSRAPHAGTLDLHRELLALRRTDPVFGATRSRKALSASARSNVLAVRRSAEGVGERLLLANFGREPASMSELLDAPERYEEILGTAPGRQGLLPGRAAAIFRRKDGR